ncbi:MAG: Trk family potassium uptake protein [Eubacteriaceae bacterium]|nr:Trk family potassium uptake protein [Eubacteriaceae bacterium]
MKDKSKKLFRYLVKQYVKRDRIKPPQILVIGFGITIFVGALLLTLPIAAKSGESTNFLTALFTATSAVCVTGLVVVDTGTYWTPFGQTVIILLIQIGGLGFMTMTTLMFLIAGKKITIKERIIIADSLSASNLEGVIKFVRYVLLYTFVVEGIGAVLLSIRFIPDYGLVKGILFGIFHAISSFCNAGFDLIGGYRSHMPYVNDFIVNFAVCSLIVLGGIGFAVTNDVLKNKSWRRFNLHTKMVVSITSVLILGGALLFYIMEYNNPGTMADLPWYGKIFASFYQSITPRTAGSNTIDQLSMTNGSIFLTMIFMFIGGSPGSTAGGVKTTTFGVIFMTVVSVLRGRTETEAFGRTIVFDIVKRAMSLVLIGMIILVVDILILSATEQHATLTQVAFEAFSGFGTVGLSMSLTPTLTPIGRVMIILTMFAGRVGPLTIAFAISEIQSAHESGKYRYPEGNILI